MGQPRNLEQVAYEQYERRYDPEQPWRFICPKCSSTRVQIRKGSIQDYQGERLYCYGCKGSISEVYDKKTGKLINNNGN